MECFTIYDERHQWHIFGRDPSKSEKIIDTNQCMIVNEGQAILLDPGGVELFAPMLAAISKKIEVESLKTLFASHQDPDVISSLGLWDQVLTDAKLYSSGLWESYIRHFGVNNIEYAQVADSGCYINLLGLNLEVVPAHYLHSSANFHIYDSVAKVFFSGDVGAALEEPGSGLYVEDFDSHIQYMKFFHQRWMPSEIAKQAWIKRVRDLDIEMLVPQHGRIFKGEEVGLFLDWFESLPVGIAV